MQKKILSENTVLKYPFVHNGLILYVLRTFCHASVIRCMFIVVWNIHLVVSIYHAIYLFSNMTTIVVYWRKTAWYLLRYLSQNYRLPKIKSGIKITEETEFRLESGLSELIWISIDTWNFPKLLRCNLKRYLLKHS